MHGEIVADYESLSVNAAKYIAESINAKPDAVIGFATGSTPLGLYKHLIRLHELEGLDFSKITCFNLDEYIGLSPNHEQSYHYFMWQNLFLHVNVNKGAVYIPSGTSNDAKGHCDWYEQKIRQHGGIDVQILGIGVNGHLGFNEPGSSFGSRTRVTRLMEETIASNARFFDRAEDVPGLAITMGLGTILEARKLLLLASGENKSAAIHAALEGPLTAMMPGSAIQLHPDTHILIDRAAASELTQSHYYLG